LAWIKHLMSLASQGPTKYHESLGQMKIHEASCKGIQGFTRPRCALQGKQFVMTRASQRLARFIGHIFYYMLQGITTIDFVMPKLL
jgi:hypothetical protein